MRRSIGRLRLLTEGGKLPRVYPESSDDRSSQPKSTESTGSSLKKFFCRTKHFCLIASDWNIKWKKSSMLQKNKKISQSLSKGESHRTFNNDLSSFFGRDLRVPRGEAMRRRRVQSCVHRRQIHWSRVDVLRPRVKSQLFRYWVHKTYWSRMS